MKKLTALFIALILLFSLSSCSSQRKVVSVGNAEISEELFTYFLTQAKAENPSLTTNEKLREAGYKKATEYVTVNTKFMQSKLSLSVLQKEAIASDVENLWHTFNEYYKSLGISRTTLTKVRTSEEYRNTLLTSLYAEGGKEEIPQKKIKEYFYSEYIAFQAITGYLTQTDENGNLVKLDENEIKKLKNEFSQMAKQIADGLDINYVKESYLKAHGYEPSEAEITVYKKGGAFFPKNFFDSASKLKYNKPGVISSDSHIFLVVLKDMSKDEESYYNKYKDICLKELANENFNKKVSSWTKDFEIKTSDNLADKCCKIILNTERK